MTLLLWGLACCALAAAAASLPSTYRLGVTTALGAVGCALAFGASLDTLLRGSVATVHTARLLPMFGLTLSLDPLGALFVLAAAFVGFACCIYCVGYARDEMRSRSALALLMTFIVALLAVPIAASIIPFLLSWNSWPSVPCSSSSPTSAIVAMLAAPRFGTGHDPLGAASILLGLLLLTTHGGGQSSRTAPPRLDALTGPSFLRLRAHASGLRVKGRGGAAARVASQAHPEAPSPVSALMSSAMVALGVYGIIRVGVDLLGGGTVWWWVAVASFGAVSALYGALHATTATDVKRLLAYSTIDILGLVLVGVGAAGALVDTGHLGVGELALTAALLLVLAHADSRAPSLGRRVRGTVHRHTQSRPAGRTDSHDALHRGYVRAGCVLDHGGTDTERFLERVALASGTAARLQGSKYADPHRDARWRRRAALTGGLTAVAFVKAFGYWLLGSSPVQWRTRFLSKPRPP